MERTRTGTEESGMLLGRPVEDRTFETVELATAVAVGLVIGLELAGPLGAVVGAGLGALVGYNGAEALERAMGPAATTTDATGMRRPAGRSL
jgi:hypothetical protein